MSFFRDLLESVVPTAYAEEPVEDVEVEQPEDAPEEEVSEETVEDDDEDEDEDEDDEDEDEEETVDPLDALREECTKTAACKPFDHHFHECIERVTKEQEEPDYEHKHYKEDCIEEFFHLQHCVNDCVAPRLFNRLK
ncbi:subunit of the ubiquinol-cytochrome c reductase complex, putative [Candida dubliniensis CD36]|uniref:Cytochrome b-c1 complex subunit 6, mitochondrial n=1 Tax=Candida dubliniensis (strain CD36 / ATCC MYA-646 / CBS 7987 / NCPF 3949 / NRRL Y-17841) TaxID=573826 RepID=B9WE04_CANDC|nr:subunit of the ubiquinol-cytochrome c reductase complex, putative [Candida dubliniensis CD36]CAX42914.1 subunit of the ubiquinol-cytochrome c reductase complex, putative [Candida dubliniensis CD36]